MQSDHQESRSHLTAIGILRKEATMKNKYQIYAVFSSRSAIESVIDVMREEGFRSPDLQVMVGLPEDVERTDAEKLHLHAHKWFAGVPASHIHSDLGGFVQRANSFSRTANLEPALYEYLAKGGLLLAITICNSSERAVALEVLEDIGVTWFEGPSSGATGFFYRELQPPEQSGGVHPS
jgi:hypothetical protein